MKKILVACALIMGALPAAQAAVIYENVNEYALSNSFGEFPLEPNIFTLTTDTYIQTIEGYFVPDPVPGVGFGLFNQGLNTQTIANTAAVDMGGFHPNFYQVATINQVVAAGTYRITISDESRWGFNSISNYRGLSRVTGIDAVDAVPEPGSWALLSLGVAGAAYFARRRRA